MLLSNYLSDVPGFELLQQHHLHLLVALILVYNQPRVSLSAAPPHVQNYLTNIKSIISVYLMPPSGRKRTACDFKDAAPPAVKTRQSRFELRNKSIYIYNVELCKYRYIQSKTL